MKIEKIGFHAGQGTVQPKRTQESALREVAQMYEKQFLRELVKSMRSAVSESDLIEKSPGRDIYREQLDAEYVESWGNQGGIGLQELIYNQLKEKFLEKGPSSIPKERMMKIEGLRPGQLKSPIQGQIIEQKRIELGPDQGFTELTLMDAKTKAEHTLKIPSLQVQLRSDSLEMDQPLPIQTGDIPYWLWVLEGASPKGMS